MHGLNLMEAAQQWAKRPDDERFWSLEEARDACKAYRDTAREAQRVPYANLRTEARDGEVMLLGRSDVPARLNHWSFGQLSQRVGAPAGYLRELPATLAVQNLNHGLAKVHERDGERVANILMHQNGGFLVRAFTSDNYERVWNHEVMGRLVDLQAKGWRTPPARPAKDGGNTRIATERDVVVSAHPEMGVKVGDTIAPAGIYASDHDMFCFMVNDEHRVQDGTEEGMSRGFFVKNSEVGASSLSITRFLYRFVCGNHIVWDAKDVVDIRLTHVGQVRSRFGSAMRAELEAVSRSAQEDEAKVKRAQGYVLGKDRDEVLDKLFGLKVESRKTLERAWDAADAHYLTDGSPATAWGMAQGLTRISQEEKFQDARDGMDRAAGKVLRMAF